MNQLSYYNFNFNFSASQNFDIFQDQIFLETISDLEKSRFKKKVIKYECHFLENSIIDPNKPGIIICIKDNLELLEFTIKKIIKFKILNLCNLIIVDDRPSNNLIEKYCNKNKINYLKVNNEYGFNFSMLNNIAAKLFYDKKCTDIILWNSDLWAEDKDTIPSLLQYHKNLGSDITGTRLLYPRVSWDGSTEVPENISNFFSIDTYRETCQFGGSNFIQIDNSLHSTHYGRFKNKKYSEMNRPVDFITGAFMIIDLNKFVQIGGLNPSLATQCQDVDLCLKIREDDGIIFYVGEKFLYHDESVSLKEKQKNFQYISDNVLNTKIWNKERVLKIITGEL
jgi:GT2 family glycosyltransferase